MSKLRVAIAQFNAIVGDLAGNVERLLGFAARAQTGGANVLLTPELALCGYPPEDLLLRPDFYRACDKELMALAAATPLPMVIGHATEIDGRHYNAASLIAHGQVLATYRKHRLPNYEVFDEARYFTAGDEPCLIELNGVRCGLAICADVWASGPAEQAAVQGAELLLTLNASPFHSNKKERRYEVLRERVKATGRPVIYANLVGGQDELVFDGASFALDDQGRVTHQLPSFVETLAFIDYADGRLLPGEIAPAMSYEAEIYGALTLGIRDYLGKNRFPGAILGLSGGIDSALTLAIAFDALAVSSRRPASSSTAVSYTRSDRLRSEPKAVSNCHCKMCQKQHGAAFATYASMPKSDLEYLFGQKLLTSYNSSGNVVRKFCSVCGSNIEWSGSKTFPDWVSIAVASLDTSFEPKCIKDIHLESRACWLQSS